MRRYLLWFVVSLFASSESSPWSCPTTMSSNSDGQFIVRFREYRPGSYWRNEMEKLLGRSKTWEWIDRDNAASQYNTDFAVVKMSSLVAHFLKRKLLGSCSWVKDIWPDRAVRGLTTVDDNDRLEFWKKPPGRWNTRWSFGLDNDNDDPYEASELKRKLLRSRSRSVTEMLKAKELWDMGYSGQKIKVGVFDTGIREDHPHVRNIKERTNWTHQKTLSDGLGHGSFVAGVIAGSYSGCPGFAPDVDLHTFKVFTDDQVSYTSWFLDAFNYAILSGLDIVNLSIGGPDFLDRPFVEKVLEVTSSGIIMLSAIGNDGPLYGTLNNPADQNDVIGIGGITYSDDVAHFSSRGMSTWELPFGYGRIKPDVMAYAQDVSGSKMTTGCRKLSGTSVASPVAAGAVALLASTVSEDARWKILNPAAMKQALVEGADRLPYDAVYVQGAGKINLKSSMHILQSYEPRASLIPNALDLTDCPYMWPFCMQPLYADAVPVIINTTVLNGLGVTGTMDRPVFTPDNDAGRWIEMEFEYSDVLWPWSGYLAIYITVASTGRSLEGTASGTVSFTVTSPPKLGEKTSMTSRVSIPFRAGIVPTPPRNKRILWDQFHSIKYPPGYFPRDNIDGQRDILDWHGDHLHTNFHEVYDRLEHDGYYFEILGSPLTCFNASQYGALMIVDSEDTFYSEEIQKLEADVKLYGLGLIVLAEWYNAEQALGFKFFDDNTRSWWTPRSGGGHVPGLNALLHPYGIAFGEAILKGSQSFGKHRVTYASGADIVRFPSGGYLHEFIMEDRAGDAGKKPYHTLGLTEYGHGRVIVYGDTNCLDSSYHGEKCFELLRAMLDYVNRNSKNDLLDVLLREDRKLTTALNTVETLPTVIDEEKFKEVSHVLSHPLQCYRNSPPLQIKHMENDVPSVDDQSDKGEGDVKLEKKMRRTSVEWTEEEGVITGEGWRERDGDDVRFKGSTGRIEWSPPPVFLSKWSALLGIIIVISLYKLTRRRRQATNST